MLVTLPTISFLCVGLLSVFLPVHRVHSNVVNMTFVLWLITANFIHGINALIWSDNVEIIVPVWCDVVTKIILASNVALPAACLCIAADLERVSSKRKLVDRSNKYLRRAEMLWQVLVCCCVPVLYMAIHFIAQSHRYDLVRNFGPFASIHPSMPALLTIWIPPLVLCFVSFVFLCRSIHHSFALSYYNFQVHLTSRSESLTSSLFFRRVGSTMGLTVVLFVVNLFSVFSPPLLKPWDSWDSVHREFSRVRVVMEKDEVGMLQLTWWAVPVTSFVYLFFAFAVGEETRDIIRWLMKTWPKVQEYVRSRSCKILLPQHHATSVSKSQSPIPLELKSGWDDMLVSSPKPTQQQQRSTSSLSGSTTEFPDESFKKCTLEYLGTPPARSLGLRSPIEPPSAAHMPPSPYSDVQDGLAEIIALLPPPAPRPKPLVPEDAVSTISSIITSSWPLPPVAVPDSPVFPSRRSPTKPNYPLRRSITPPHLQSVPFRGPGVSPVLPGRQGQPYGSGATHSKRPSLTSINLRRSPSSKDGLKVQQNRGSDEVIYMTVVRETTTTA